jgi:hypothetical protein
VRTAATRSGRRHEGRKSIAIMRAFVGVHETLASGGCQLSNLSARTGVTRWTKIGYLRISKVGGFTKFRFARCATSTKAFCTLKLGAPRVAFGAAITAVHGRQPEFDTRRSRPRLAPIGGRRSSAPH